MILSAAQTMRDAPEAHKWYGKLGLDENAEKRYNPYVKIEFRRRHAEDRKKSRYAAFLCAGLRTSGDIIRCFEKKFLDVNKLVLK